MKPMPDISRKMELKTEEHKYENGNIYDNKKRYVPRPMYKLPETAHLTETDKYQLWRYYVIHVV